MCLYLSVCLSVSLSAFPSVYLTVSLTFSLTVSLTVSVSCWLAGSQVAVLIIQTAYRAYRDRVNTAAEREEELIFLGMKPAPEAAEEHKHTLVQLEAARSKRKADQVREIDG